MKQLVKCAVDDSFIRMSDAYRAQVNEMNVDLETGKQINKTYKVFICKTHAVAMGYKQKTKKKNAKEAKT